MIKVDRPLPSVVSVFQFQLFPTPSLYLPMDKGAPERFARALHDRVSSANSKLTPLLFFEGNSFAAGLNISKLI